MYLPDHVLLRTLAETLARDRATTAELLSLMGEVERRGLFRGEGYPSMFRYCVDKLRMSEDMAYKRMQAARAARRYRAILPAIADGRLHLSAVVLLKPHLKPDNADKLLAAAMGKTKAQIELWLAERFPKADVATSIKPIAASVVLVEAPRDSQVPPASLSSSPATVPEMPSELVPEPVLETPALHAIPLVPLAPPRPVAPLSPGKYELRLTMSQEFHDKLRRAQELLSHIVPSGDIPTILERALDDVIAKQEKLKFGATERPRRARSSSSSRHIPAAMKRAVMKRDQGQCTYVSDKGRRCGSRKFLEYDHELPLARGGRTCVENLRLRCRAHNQLEAERVLGAGFMGEKRARSATA